MRRLAGVEWVYDPAATTRTPSTIWALLHRAGLAASNGEARRLVRGGGIKVNDVKVDDEAAAITSTAAVDGIVKLSAGKKRIALVRIVG